MTNAVMTMATLFAPKVRYASTFDSQFDVMMTWRAELELGYLDGYDDDGDMPHVVGGFAEFVIIHVGQHPIADLLDSLSNEAAAFSVLFDGDEVNLALQERFEDSPFNRVLIVTDVEVAEALRGHQLGAWLVAEVIARMASPIDTLVLLSPDPAVAGGGAEFGGAPALSRYWQRCGLSLIEGHSDFLCASTAYSHVLNARDALRAVGDVEIAVPRSLIRPETPDDPRHTLLVDPEPMGLRLVRD